MQHLTTYAHILKSFLPIFSREATLELALSIRLFVHDASLKAS